MKDATRTAIYGASGSGKSTYTRKRIATERRLVVFDVVGEYGGTGKMRTCRSIKELKEAMRAGWQRGFRLAYLPVAGQEETELHKVSQLLCGVQKPYFNAPPSTNLPKITFAVEELNTGFPVHQLPSDIRAFYEVCSRGRHYGLNVLGIAQRPAEINTRWRGNLSEVVSFQLTAPSDYTAIRDTCGGEGVQVMNLVKNLQKYQAIQWKPGQVSPVRSK